MLAESFKSRIALYSLIFVGYYFLAIAFVLLKQDFGFIVSDGRGYYVYLSSAVIDFDLDFTNQIVQNWGQDFSEELLDARTRNGYVYNKYPIGLALSLLPFFLIAHGLSSFFYSAGGWPTFFPDGYSVLYQLVCLLGIQLYGWSQFCLMDRFLCRQAKIAGPIVFIAVIAYWTLSHYAYYYFREPFMVHAVSSFWVTAAVLLCLTHRSTPWVRWPLRPAVLLVFCAAMAVVLRPTNMVVIAPFVVYSLLGTRIKDIQLSKFLVCAVGLLPIVLQLSAWKIMHDSWIFYSYDGEGFNFGSPHLMETLFSSKHGLFFWSPVLLLAVAGFCLQRLQVQPYPFKQLTLVSFLLLWYANSSWHVWWFGDAFGARAFLELSIFFVFGLALFGQWLDRHSARPLRICLVSALAFALLNYGLMALYISRRVPRADYLF